jgi:hypothetical protein
MANIATMYKGVEGSPETKLVNAISNIATTITIQDASVLPAAPNFACLFDETGKVEVIEYTVKSGQNLTCIRGVSGQRLAWPIGTSVARNFTAIDYNRVVDNVSAMNAELNELSVEYQYLFDAVVEGDFVQQVLQMAEEVDALHIEVNGLLDDLTTLESQLQANEQARQIAESSRVTAEGLRVTAESSRVTAESSRAASESTRQTNESTRQTKETARGVAESGRVTAEGSRVTAESGRVDAESGRVTVEGQRVSAETARATAESTRVSAETIRDQKETQRQTDETARATAESSRASAESQRANNENVRQTNESQRQTTEGQRNSAESLRSAAESSRATAESSRVSAESSRVTAEDTRVANETNRQAQLTEAINAASVSAQQAQGFRDTAYSHAQYAESMRDAVAIFASDAEDAAVRAEDIASSLGGIQDWALQPTKPTYTHSEVGAAPAVHTHIISDILNFPTSMPASDVYPWAKDESKPIYTAAEIGASEVGHVHDYAPSTHNHIAADIIGFPESMPASDVSAWAKQPSKPTYTYSEVGAAPESHSHDLAYLGIGAKAADSDKLDGYHASAFATAVHEHASLPLFTPGNASNAIAIDSLDTNGIRYVGSVPHLFGQTDGACFSQAYSAAWSSQIYQDYRTGQIALRGKNSGVWQTWRGVLDTLNFINYVYPVGSIYMSISSTSPATLFGGTWSALPTGRFLRTGTGGSTGGSDTHVHSGPWHGHGLTTAYAKINGVNGDNYLHIHQISSGGNWYSNNAGNKFTSFVAGGGVLGQAAGLGGNTDGAGNGDTGSASNVPAYYEVYAWRRTA